MAKSNDSSQVRACLNQDSSETQRSDDSAQRGETQKPVRDLIDFYGDTSTGTSFERPDPSAVSCSTTGATGSSSGSGSKPGSGEGIGEGSRPGVSRSGSRSGPEARSSAGREDSGRGGEHRGSPSETSSGSMQWESSGASYGTTRDTPEWTPKKVWDCRANLGPLKHNNPEHTVLIDVREFSRNQTLKSIDGRQWWDGFHVKMPHAHENTIVKSSFLSGPDKQQRWTSISKHLKKLLNGSPTVADVEKAILSFNPKYEHSWSFEGLHKYAQTVPKHEAIFSTVIPRMADLALRLPQYIPKAIPLLKQGRSHSITLSQLQIAALLANAFYCTFPRRNDTSRNAEYANYPTINFSRLFGNASQTTVEKWRAIFHYFNTVPSEKDSRPSGLVTFERRCIPEAKLPRWRDRTEVLGHVRVMSQGSIEEEGEGMLQVDFACNMVGGGVLGSGLVQEEILFLMNPELIVARLFTEKLSDNECLKITGSQWYSDYSGYSDSFEWRGPHHDRLRRDQWKRLQREIVAIDALNFRNPREQYQKRYIRRELNKAFVGFSEEGQELPTVATGNWGCGAFHGDPILKALIQMMAAAVARRDLIFFTFRDKHLEKKLQQIHTVLKERGSTVGDLYTMLEFFCQPSENHKDLHRFILTYLNVPPSSL